MNPRGVIGLALVAAFLLPMAPGSAAAQDSCVCWAQVGAVSSTDMGPYLMFGVTYESSANGGPTLGIVFLATHNSLGQTVEISTGSVVLAPGANGTAFPVVFGLAPGAYSGIFFAITASGVAISQTTVLNFTV